MVPSPFAYRSLFMIPFRMDGETASGILIQHHVKIPPVYGQVTAVHPTVRDVRVGDWIVYLPHRPVRLPYRDGIVYALDERQVQAIVEPGDGKPWFTEESEK